jgi:GntR family transcriptional regulator, transcriptional repressor for pyruvate dehydrogenase complex
MTADLPLDGAVNAPPTENTFGEQLGGPKLSDRVAVDLQVRILSGEFEPTYRLPPEAKLCEAFGVSRSVIRDAIRTLAARGLVDVQQGRGTTISEPREAALGFAMLTLVMRSAMTMADVFEMRAVVEGNLLPLATQRRTDENVRQASEQFVLFKEAVERNDSAAAHQHHLGFHIELIQAIGLPALTLVMRPLDEIINLSSFPPRDDDPSLWEVDVHHSMLLALEAGDAGAMSEALAAHFDYLRHEPYQALREARVRDAVNVEALRAAVQRASL